MKYLAVLMSLIIVGCVTTPVMIDQAKSAPTKRVYESYSKYRDPKTSNSEIVIVRDKGVLGAAGSAALFVNGELIARVRTAESITLFVQEGDNVIGVDPGTKMAWEKDNIALIEQSIYVQPNKTYFYRIVERVLCPNLVTASCKASSSFAFLILDTRECLEA